MRKRVITEWDLRQAELDRIKEDYMRHLGRLNRLRLFYREWFDRQFQTFVDAIKTVQIAYPSLIPKQITCMSHFVKTLDFAQRLPKNGNMISKNVEKIAQFLGFWKTFCELKREGDVLNTTMCEFCARLTRLREPHIRDEIDKMQARLTQASGIEFDFTNLHNERDNLFVYRIARHDDQLQPLVGYLPYLLKIATNICYWSSKLFMEKL